MVSVLAALVLVILQFIPVSSAEQLSAKTIPVYEKIIKHPNDSAVLNCTVSSGGPIKSFTWKHNGETLRNVNNSAGPIYWLDLVVNGTRESAGLYTCEAISEDNESDKAEIAVHIQGKPQFITYKSSHSPQTPRINEDLDLWCYATGFPKPHFTWLRNGVKIAGDDHTIPHHINYRVEKVENGLGSALHITAIQKEDQNTHFTCVAENKFGNETRRIRVIIDDHPHPANKPAMEASSQQMSVTVGDRNVTLVCIGKYATFGESSTFWKFKGMRFDDMHDNDNNKSYSVHNYTVLEEYLTGQNPPKVKTSLVINSVSGRDEGNFTCGLSTIVTRNPALDFIYLSVTETRQPGAREDRTALLVGLGVSAALVLCIIVAAFFVFYFWSREKKRKKLAQKYDIDGNIFKNDVFITYSGKDFDWVNRVLVPLFDAHSVRYIIHFRDFVLGKALTDNMADSVYQSRRILVVMSKNYMASGYCKEELQMAVHRSVGNDESPVIVIRIDNIGKKALPKSLRNKTFLDYASKVEEETWQKRLLEIVKVPESFHEESGKTEEEQNMLHV